MAFTRSGWAGVLRPFCSVIYLDLIKKKKKKRHLKKLYLVAILLGKIPIFLFFFPFFFFDLSNNSTPCTW